MGILSLRMKQLVSEGPSEPEYSGSIIRELRGGASPERTALVQKLRSIAGSQCHRLHDGNTNILPGLYQCMSIPTLSTAASSPDSSLET